MKNKKKKNQETPIIDNVHAESTNVLATIKASQLIDVSIWEEKQKKLVAENPFFEIVDNKTYEAGKKHRTNVVKGRTELQNQDKLVASTFATIRKEVGSETATLIEITQPLEDQWQKAVKDWEDRKEREKKEAAEAEALRIKTIKDKIDEFETDSYKIIQETNIGNVNLQKSMLDAMVNTEFDFEEYDVLFEQVRSRIQVSWDAKCSDIQEKEDQRIANEKLEEENNKIKSQQELQATRLNELLPYNPYGQTVDMATLWVLSDEAYAIIFEEKKALFDAHVLENKKIEDDRIAKEEEEKEAIYAIREKRLLDLGMKYSDEHDTFFISEDNEYILLKDDVYDCSQVEFEETFEEVKTIFKEASDRIEKEKVFEIRKEKLAEIGFNVQEEKSGFFIHPLLFDGVDVEALLNLDETWFENKISEAKLAIEKAKSDAKQAIFESRKNTLISIGYIYDESQEYAFFMSDDWKCTKDVVEEIHESRWEEFVNDAIAHQKRLDDILSKEDAKKLKAKNKARIAEYASDKKVLSEFVKSLGFSNAIPELENDDIKAFLDGILESTEGTKRELLSIIYNF